MFEKLDKTHVTAPVFAKHNLTYRELSKLVGVSELYIKDALRGRFSPGQMINDRLIHAAAQLDGKFYRKMKKMKWAFLKS